MKRVPSYKTGKGNTSTKIFMDIFRPTLSRESNEKDLSVYG